MVKKEHLLKYDILLHLPPHPSTTQIRGLTYESYFSNVIDGKGKYGLRKFLFLLIILICSFINAVALFGGQI